MPGIWKIYKPGIRYPADQPIHLISRNRVVLAAPKDENRHVNLVEPVLDVVIYQADKGVSHHSIQVSIIGRAKKSPDYGVSQPVEPKYSEARR